MKRKKLLRPWALVTGASSGIGEATARKLADAGYDLVLMARRSDRLKKLEDSIGSAQPMARVECVSLDISDTKKLASWIQKNSKLIQKIEVLVNCAGLAKGVDKIQDTQFGDVQTMIDVNLKGLLQLSLPIVKSMSEKKLGHVVNLGSVAGRWVYPGGAVYCATKFAVRAISDAMRQDLLGRNVRVTNIEPGMVETEFSVVRMGDQKKADQVYQGMRPLTAQDIASTILWCLSQPIHVNIQELVIYPTDQAHVGMVHRN